MVNLSGEVSLYVFSRIQVGRTSRASQLHAPQNSLAVCILALSCGNKFRSISKIYYRQQILTECLYLVAFLPSKNAILVVLSALNAAQTITDPPPFCRMKNVFFSVHKSWRSFDQLMSLAISDMLLP
jgi:hypothetical protein